MIYDFHKLRGKRFSNIRLNVINFAWKCNQGHFPDLVCGIVHKCLNSFLKGQMENISGFAGNVVSIV